MRRSIVRLIKALSQKCEFTEPIYEFGALRARGQENRPDIRTFFPGRKYVGSDLEKGLGVDVILNLHNIDLPNNSVGSAIVLDVLEHVEFCKRATEEIHRILKPGGVVIIVSEMYFPIHAHPSDYWRFTPEGFRSLLAPFQEIIIGYFGLADLPTTVIGIAFKGGAPKDRVEKFRIEVSNWKNHIWYSWQEYITIFLPPILFTYLYRLYRILEIKRHKK